MTPKELLALLKLPLANALYNTLHALRQEARIQRQELGGYHLYVSADRQRANQQLMARRQAMDQEPSAPVVVSEDTLIAVLVEALQGAELLVSASMVASRLAARGVAVTTAQVEQIFTRYGLEPGKKRWTDSRDGCRSQGLDPLGRSALPSELANNGDPQFLGTGSFMAAFGGRPIDDLHG
jgi:hypothetical protein